MHGIKLLYHRREVKPIGTGGLKTGSSTKVFAHINISLNLLNSLKTLPSKGLHGVAQLFQVLG